MWPAPGRVVSAAAASFLLCALVSACSQYIDPDVPEPIRPRVEPEHGGEYLLYRPSSYDRDRVWPLIVTCHGSFPDSPNRQIRDWTQLAERYGFLVAAPVLEGNKGRWPLKPHEQIRLQQRDEQRILAVIRHVRAGHNISEDRIFIHGFSGGAYAALHTGLRHAELFRAIALSHPRFDESYMADAEDLVDYQQPVFVSYQLTDAITGKHAQRCIDWLRPRRANLTVDAHAVSLATDAELPVSFFERVVRMQPWIRIRAFPVPDGDPLRIQFKLRASYRPTFHRWEFERGRESTAAEPIHLFPSPGTYRVAVTVNGPRGGRHRRTVAIKVPEAVLAPAGESASRGKPGAAPESP